MARYDLSDFRSLPWVRYLWWFRAGIILAGTLLGVWIAIGAYQLAAGPGVTPAQGAGVAMASLIVGLFLALGFMFRTQAVGLTIDMEGIRLDYRRGPPFVRSWKTAGLTIRGRRTDGVNDSVSGGRALWSVYGRFGGLTESFIPLGAYEELLRVSSAHQTSYHEKSGGVGWFLYQIRRS